MDIATLKLRVIVLMMALFSTPIYSIGSKTCWTDGFCEDLTEFQGNSTVSNNFLAELNNYFVGWQNQLGYFNSIVQKQYYNDTEMFAVYLNFQILAQVIKADMEQRGNVPMSKFWAELTIASGMPLPIEREYLLTLW
jgi:hypothetical protein